MERIGESSQHGSESLSKQREHRSDISIKSKGGLSTLSALTRSSQSTFNAKKNFELSEKTYNIKKSPKLSPLGEILLRIGKEIQRSGRSRTICLEYSVRFNFFSFLNRYFVAHSLDHILYY